MKREFPNSPIVAVGGVVFKNNKILLAKRKNPPDKDMWSIPGGAVEIGETLQEAIQREIAEECRIKVNSGRIISIIDKIYYKHMNILYHYEIIDFEFKDFTGIPHPASDASDVKFFTLSEILNNNSVVLSVKELVRKVYINTPAKRLPLYFTYKTKE